MTAAVLVLLRACLALEWGRPERGMRVEEVPARGAARGASRSGLRGALMELLRVGALAGADIMRAILGGPSVCSMKVPLLDGCGLLLLPGLLLPARDLLGLSIRIASTPANGEGSMATG